MPRSLTEEEKTQIKALLSGAAIALPENRKHQLILAESIGWTEVELDRHMAQIWLDFGSPDVARFAKPVNDIERTHHALLRLYLHWRLPSDSFKSRLSDESRSSNYRLV